MPTLLAVVSDTHCGSTVALCPPRIELDDGGFYQASNAQIWLWSLWESFWQEAQALRKKRKAKLYCVFNGDITEGAHHGTTQILSGNSTAQAAVVDACMAVPLSLKPDRLFFVRGTEAHVGKSACYEERIALGLKKDGRPVVSDPDSGTASWWRLRMEVEGVRFDFAHHGRVGTRPWTRINVTANLAAQIFYEHAKSGDPYPHIAVRSHLHQHVDTHDAHPVRVIQTPAFQLATAFVHRIGAESLADIGGILILCENGEATVKNVISRPSRGELWRES